MGRERCSHSRQESSRLAEEAARDGSDQFKGSGGRGGGGGGRGQQPQQGCCGHGVGLDECKVPSNSERLKDLS